MFGLVPHFGYFATAAMNIPVQVFVWIYFQFLWVYTKSGTAGLCGDSMLSILGNCQTVFQTDRTILHSYQQCTETPVSPHP